MNENTRFRIDHEPSLLHLLFTNKESMVDNLGKSAPLGISDHVCIAWTFYCSADVNTNEEGTQKRSLYETDFNSVANSSSHMATIDWERTCRLENTEVEDSRNIFKLEYENCIDLFVPVKSIKTQKKQPWSRKRIKEAVRWKNILFKKYKRTKQYVDKLTYIRQRNETGEIIRNSKREFESDIMRSVETEPN